MIELDRSKLGVQMHQACLERRRRSHYCLIVRTEKWCSEAGFTVLHDGRANYSLRVTYIFSHAYVLHALSHVSKCDPHIPMLFFDTKRIRIIRMAFGDNSINTIFFIKSRGRSLFGHYSASPFVKHFTPRTFVPLYPSSR